MEYASLAVKLTLTAAVIAVLVAFIRSFGRSRPSHANAAQGFDQAGAGGVGLASGFIAGSACSDGASSGDGGGGGDSC